MAKKIKSEEPAQDVVEEVVVEECGAIENNLKAINEAIGYLDFYGAELKKVSEGHHNKAVIDIAIEEAIKSSISLKKSLVFIAKALVDKKE